MVKVTCPLTVDQIEYLVTSDDTSAIVETSDLPTGSILGYLKLIGLDSITFGENVISEDLLKSYMTIRSITPRSNLIELHANALFYYIHGRVYNTNKYDDMVTRFVENNRLIMEQHIKVIQSIPLYLKMAAGRYSGFVEFVDEPLDYVSSNIFHLAGYDNELLLLLVSDSLAGVPICEYYRYHFDRYVDNKRLIQSFIDNPSNMLHQLVN